MIHLPALQFYTNFLKYDPSRPMSFYVLDFPVFSLIFSEQNIYFFWSWVGGAKTDLFVY